MAVPRYGVFEREVFAEYSSYQLNSELGLDDADVMMTFVGCPVIHSCAIFQAKLGRPQSDIPLLYACYAVPNFEQWNKLIIVLSPAF